MDFLIKLQNIDRRILYVMVALTLSVPLIARPSKHPKIVLPEVQRAYDAIDKVPPGKFVLLSTNWGAGTKAENEPQTEALMRHMFAKHIKFAIMSWDPAGSEITYQSAIKIQNAVGAKYGRDWVHLGYKIGNYNAIISGLAEDFPGFMKQDVLGTPLKKLPAVSYVKNSDQIGVVVDITAVGFAGGATIGSAWYWIAYLTTPKHIPLIYCPTAVMSTSAYPYLDSGQFCGMLNGVMGAVQYETLIGRGNVATDASASSWALSAAHIYILLLIIIGNLGYLAAKHKGARTGGSNLG